MDNKEIIMPDLRTLRFSVLDSGPYAAITLDVEVNPAPAKVNGYRMLAPRPRPASVEAPIWPAIKVLVNSTADSDKYEIVIGIELFDKNFISFVLFFELIVSNCIFINFNKALLATPRTPRYFP